jgi:hypothetical protein
VTPVGCWTGCTSCDASPLRRGELRETQTQERWGVVELRSPKDFRLRLPASARTFFKERCHRLCCASARQETQRGENLTGVATRKAREQITAFLDDTMLEHR